MALTRGQVAQLYTPIYDDFMLSTFSEDTQVMPQVYKVIEDSSKDYLMDDLSGLGEWTDATEGGAGGYSTPVQGYVQTLTPAKRWKKLSVSYEAVDQDEYALLSKEDDAKQMGRGARMNIEKKAASILYNGFTVAGPDGQFLFSNAHPKNREETGITYDNLLDGPFSHDNLEAAEKQMSDNFFAPDGVPIEVPENPIILYPPALKGMVMRTLSDRAQDRPGTQNRDINIFAGRYTPIEWKYLNAALGGSDAAWYIIYKSLGFLVFDWQVKPHYTSWIDEDLELYNFKGRMLYDCNARGWRCGFGSTGL